MKSTYGERWLPLVGSHFRSCQCRTTDSRQQTLLVEVVHLNCCQIANSQTDMLPGPRLALGWIERFGPLSLADFIPVCPQFGSIWILSERQLDRY
jgi:hypothetical protein